MREVVIGTAGHIDHGKTTLVKALTGIETDKLQEEKSRGITIELGFAAWPISSELEASIVDVPGHEKLVRTMVAGAAGIDIGMLVVAADDGVMPQTREHLDILALLGVAHLVVVLTKTDMVDAELIELVRMDVEELLEKTPYASSPVLPVSAKTSEGLDALTRTIEELSAKAAPRPHEGPAYFPVDRAFKVPGKGWVITGTLLRGSLQKDSDVVLMHPDSPTPEEVRIRTLQTRARNRKRAAAGTRVAINLAGLDDQVSRGCILTSPHTFVPSTHAVADVRVLPAATALQEETLMVHVGTREVEATVLPLGVETIEAHKQGGMWLRFSQPVAMFAGQRVLFRRPGSHGQSTVAGATILDPLPFVGKGAVTRARKEYDHLKGDLESRLLSLARSGRSKGLQRQQLAQRVPESPHQVLKQLEERGDLVAVGKDQSAWHPASELAHMEQALWTLVQTYHQEHPSSLGMPEAEIATRFPPPDRDLVQTAIARLVARQALERRNDLIVSPDAAPMDDKTEEELNKVHAHFVEAGLMPPQEKELPQALGISASNLRGLLEHLRRKGHIQRVAPGMFFSTDALAQLQDNVIEHLSHSPRMTASEFKTIAGNISRKWAIPLLEYLDRNKITRRIGDTRSLHPQAPRSHAGGHTPFSHSPTA